VAYDCPSFQYSGRGPKGARNKPVSRSGRAENKQGKKKNSGTYIPSRVHKKKVRGGGENRGWPHGFGPVGEEKKERRGRAGPKSRHPQLLALSDDEEKGKETRRYNSSRLNILRLRKGKEKGKLSSVA